LGNKYERSSRLGFFFAFAFAGADRVPSTSRMELAFRGKPLAIAEADVCWDIDKGSLDLS